MDTSAPANVFGKMSPRLLKAQGVTILASSHYIEEVEHVQRTVIGLKWES